jgi:hypothetical protein
MSEKMNEVAPPGWSGTVKAMKKHKEIDNPFALAWYMKKKGDKPHHPPEKEAKGEKKKKHKMESF